MRTTLLLLTIALACGCVRRTLSVQSDPPGALVYLNQQEVGRTPMQKDFTWYGNYDVVLRKDGYETLKASGQVAPPFWAWPGIDLLTTILPIPLKDEHSLRYTLKPASPVSAQEMFDRASNLRAQLQGPEGKPTTRKTR